MTSRTRDTRIEAVYGLTPLQHGMLFHAVETAGPQAYVESLEIALHGPLDAGALRGAFEQTVARHGALRTAFLWQRRAKPAQVVAREVSVPWRSVDLSAHETATREAELQSLVEAERARGFDLSRPPLLRCVLARLSPDHHVLVWVYHHLLLDGWSVPIVLGDVLLHYASARGRAVEIPPAAPPFRDYVQWLDTRDARHLEGFWRGALDGFIEASSIPADATPPAGSAPLWREFTRTLGETASASLAPAARRLGVTPATLAQAAWAAVLSRWTGRRDVVMGLTVSGRPDVLAGAGRMVGMFINTLPLRVAVDPAATVADWLQDVQRRQTDLREHEQAALVDVHRWCGLTHAPGAFDHILVFENYPANDAPASLLDGLRIGDVRGHERSNYPLSVVVGPGREWSVKVIHDQRHYSAETAEAVATQFLELLSRLAAGECATVANLLAPSVTEEARLCMMAGRVGTTEHASVLPLVSRHAIERPGALAIDAADKRLTYAELERRADDLARALVAAGVTVGTPVGVLLPRGASLVVALLAIWKAGGHYVPIELSYPPARVAWMIEDCGARLVVTESDSVSLPAGARAIAVTARDTSATLPAPPTADSIAYVLYTSGSTGRPKGIGIPHQAIVRLVESPNYAVVGPEIRVGQAGAIGFDASTFEIWAPLVHGGTVVIVPREALLDPDAFVQFLHDRRVTTLFVTTALFNRVADDVPNGFAALDDVMFGGEAVDARRVQRVLDAGGPRRLTHVYGPTETTTFATWHRVQQVADGARTVPIGGPIQDTTVWVLDDAMALVPIGAPGELFIGGPRLATGYYRRPSLTAERFVTHPFRPGARLYRTGDRVRWNASGALEFLARADEQVKIRGHRIEPGEIAAVLREISGVLDALVIPRETAAGRELVAYARGAGLSAEALREALQARLPSYMVPAAVAVVAEWPLTAQGKIDRAALPSPDAVAAPVERAEEWTPTEEIIAGVWRDVMGRPPAARDADFFESGGHSLLATQVATRLRDAFGIEVPLRLVFDEPRLDGLARAIDARLRAARSLPELALAPGERPDPLPLSFSQQRLWFLEQMAPPTPAYYIASALRLEGRLDVAAVERSLTELVARHEALRTSFPSAGGRPVQRIAAPSRVELPCDDLSASAGDIEALAIEAVSREAERPFDLAHGPLYRFRLIRLAPQHHILVVVLHHIIADGWSMTIFSRELTAYYRGWTEGTPPALAPLRVQYPDVAVWQRRWLQGDALRTQIDYWRRQLADVATLHLPTDRPRPPQQTFHGKARPVRIPAGVVHALSEIGRRQGATLFMTLLAAYQAMLSRYSHQTDIAIGTPVANRTRLDAEALIGFFVNLLVMRTDLGGDPRFDELVRRVRQTALDAYTHQDVPFEMLVELLRPERDPARQPLFQVHFALHNMPAGAVTLPDLRVEPVTGDVRWVRFDLECHLWRTGESVEGFWAWNTDLFDEATIERLDGHFQTLLAALATDPTRRLSSLPLATPEEARVAVEEWNAPAPVTASGETAVARFERVAARTPGAVALRFDGHSVSYADLNARANRLARRLERLGAQPETLVGIYLDRTPDLVVAILAVLKAGAAYLPIDVAYPADRIAHMLTDSRVALVLTSEARAGAVPAFEGRSILLDRERVEEEAAEDVPPRAGLSHAAYVIYTSGSTGTPKGSVITHANLVRLFDATDHWYGFGPDDVWTLFHSPAFDFSVWEIWGALLYGGRVVVVPHDVSRSPAEFVRLVESERVTVLNQTPLAFYQFMRAEMARPSPSGLALRYVIFGGDALDLPRLLPWFDRHGDAQPRLINMYGITETTVHVTYQPIDREIAERGWGSVIGRQIPDLTAYVLDSDLALVPVGVAGELYVGGAGVARGYLRRPSLTASRFVPDPFSITPGARLYRTGDAARYRATGDLEYLGRLDTQIKIRGFRVELGEIEAACRSHPAVQDAVVIVRDAAEDDRRLAAYVTCRPQLPASDDSRAHDPETHVRDWRALYDSVYAASTAGDESDFDITGWNSSLTGQPIPDHEMRAWRDETVARLRALAPRRVLEIGCGTGLLLLPLAPSCERYVGLDVSGEVLARLQPRVDRRGLAHVELLQRAAHELSAFGAGEFDAVVVNSVVQYFPSVDYLLAVVREAIRLVRPGGHIFLGDLRNLALGDAFWTAVEQAHAGGDMRPAQLARRLAIRRLQEEELLLDPALFAALRATEPRLSGVEVLLKRSAADNELSRYRYDVVLHVESAGIPMEPEVWPSERATIAGVEKTLRERGDLPLVLKGLPNPRVAETGVDPSAWWSVAERADWQVAVGWSLDGEDRYDVAFAPSGGAPAGWLLPMAAEPATPRPWEAYANDPLRARHLRATIPDLRRHLERRLPAYMLPATITMLDSLPVTAHGKVDRRALPEPDDLRAATATPPAAPRTPTESALVAIWADVLAVPQVGTQDSFFDLGGHSLLATQLVARIADHFGTDVPIRVLFDEATIEALGRYIDARPAAERRPAPAIAAVRTLSAEEVASMSDDDVEAALRQLEGEGSR